MPSLTLRLDPPQPSLEARQVSVREHLSMPFSVSVTAHATDHDLDLEAVLGNAASLTLESGVPGAARRWAGVCARAALIAAGPAGGLSTYHVMVVPRLWLTRRRRQTRLFQRLTIPQIVRQVLAPYGVEPDERLAEPHDPHEYRVQSGERDFDFLARLLAEEGVSYLFEDAPEGDSRLVLCDRPSDAKARHAPLPFAPRPTHATTTRYVSRVGVRGEVTPGRYRIRDHHFAHPGHELAGEAAGGDALERRLEQYIYDPAAYAKERDGAPRAVPTAETQRRSEIALESLRAGAVEVSFQTNALDLHPGVVVSIDGHPRRSLTEPLLITRTVIGAAVDGVAHLHAEAAPSATPYRPPLRTPKPIMGGKQSATVVGPEGEEIHTDAHGRVLVAFHWDRSRHDASERRWVRVAEMWAGGAMGASQLPRVGQEVIVDFLEGDPDLPVIVGRLYHPRNAPPFALPTQAAESGWRSATTPGGGGHNELVFDDRAGAEQLAWRAARDLEERAGANREERIGRDRRVRVDGDRRAQVDGQEHTLAGAYSVGVATTEDVARRTASLHAEEGRIEASNTASAATLAGPDVRLHAAETLHLWAGGEVVLRGTRVRINDQDVGRGAIRTAQTRGGKLLASVAQALEPIDES